MKFLKMSAVVFSAALFPVLSWAAHPLITDDAGTQGKGNSQLEVNGQHDTDNETQNGAVVKSSGVQAASIISYGIADSADLVLGIPYQRGTVREDGVAVHNEHGLSDVSVELKWRFYERDGLRLALKPGVSLPTGNEKKGLGAGKTGYAAFFIISNEIKPLDIHLNIGYKRNENTADVAERKDIWHASLAAVYEVLKELKAVANAGIETNTDKTSDRAPVFALAGIIYSPVENFDFDFGVKKGLNRIETDHSYLAGITLRF